MMRYSCSHMVKMKKWTLAYISEEVGGNYLNVKSLAILCPSLYTSGIWGVSIKWNMPMLTNFMEQPPAYLQDLVQRYRPARALRSCSWPSNTGLRLSYGRLSPCGTNSPSPSDCHQHYKIIKRTWKLILCHYIKMLCVAPENDSVGHGAIVSKTCSLCHSRGHLSSRIQSLVLLAWTYGTLCQKPWEM